MEGLGANACAGCESRVEVLRARGRRLHVGEDLWERACGGVGDSGGERGRDDTDLGGELGVVVVGTDFEGYIEFAVVRSKAGEVAAGIAAAAANKLAAAVLKPNLPVVELEFCSP